MSFATAKLEGDFLQVHISSPTGYKIPFGVGVASDPMATRRGGKILPMEDVSFYHWPLPGTEQVLEFIFSWRNYMLCLSLEKRKKK